MFKGQQGKTAEAISLYEQSLELETKNGNKAATLHGLANLKANQGDVEGAIALYQESLDITEQIGDVQIKAATLHRLANHKVN